VINFMIDLETLSLRQDAAITQIGVTPFDENGVGHGKHWRIDLSDSMRYGHVDPDTLRWWLRQSDEARAQFDLCHVPLAVALKALSYELRSAGVPVIATVWGNGSVFDIAALQHAYTQLDISCPWSYKNVRCFRTLKELFPQVICEYSGVKHHALVDSSNQAKHASLILKHIKELSCRHPMFQLDTPDCFPSPLPPCVPGAPLDIFLRDTKPETSLSQDTSPVTPPTKENWSL
jgi:hypothetical protein